MLNELVLYSTLGCHLCEQAQALIANVKPTAYNVQVVDIVDDDQLYARYRTRIPVLRHGQRELAWPFTQQQLQQWLQQESPCN